MRELYELQDLTYQIVILIFSSIFGMMLSYVLYKSNLIPRYISILGLIGYPLLLPMATLEIFGHSGGMYLFIPAGFFEIIFPLMLIVHGFNSSAIGSGTETKDTNNI